MKSHTEQVMPMNTAEVWANEQPAPAPKPSAPLFKSLVKFATLAFVVAAGVCVSFYVSGLMSLETLNAHLADSIRNSAAFIQFHAEMKRWGMQIVMAGIGGGAAVLAVALLEARAAARKWKTWREGVMKTAEQTELRAHKLLGQLADSRVSLEESQNARFETQQLLNNLSKRHAELEKELGERREAEKSLALEKQKLELSKETLEKHVQTRAQELQKLQRRNELILDSAGEGICGFDLQGRAIFVNPAAAKFTGWTIDDLVGKSEDAIFFPPKPRGIRETPGFARDDRGVCLPEQMLYRRDGSSFPAEYVRTSIRENEEVVGTVVMFKDITERRLAEDKLNRKAVELARSNRELEQFAFVASHDLQEPLRKIQAFGDRLKLKCEAVQLDEGKDYLQRMQTAAARMQILINDLLTFSRIISSSQAFVPVDLGTVAQEVLVDLEHRIEKTMARVEVGKLPTLEADPTQMRQLLQNLIGNALKFQAPGAVPVVKVEAQLITRDQLQEGTVLSANSPTNKPDDEFCLLTVKDNGIGFEEQYLEKVFAVFQRLHGRSEYEGTGVGLAVCRRIADRHNGLITAESRLGEGATFIVILPMTQPKKKS